jgi:hypothetical protein
MRSHVFINRNLVFFSLPRFSIETKYSYTGQYIFNVHIELNNYLDGIVIFLEVIDQCHSNTWIPLKYVNGDLPNSMLLEVIIRNNNCV